MDVLRAFRRAASTGICALAAATALARAQTQAPEPDIKAAYLYNFTKYVEWPSEGGPGTGPFRLCVVSDEVTRRAIERTVDGETVNGRPLVLLAPQTPQHAQQCQILFVGRSERQQASRLLAAVRDQPVLTVGDSSRFTEEGGMIEFLLQDNRVRFDVNLARAQQSKLRVSSNLLRVARKVLEPPK
jgi:hypothetical protein